MSKNFAPEWGKSKYQKRGNSSPPDSSVHGNSLGKNIGLGSHSLLLGIFPTQGSNPGLLHCRQILYRLSPRGGPTWPGLTTAVAARPAMAPPCPWLSCFLSCLPTCPPGQVPLDPVLAFLYFSCQESWRPPPIARPQSWLPGETPRFQNLPPFDLTRHPPPPQLFSAALSVTIPRCPPVCVHRHLFSVAVLLTPTDPDVWGPPPRLSVGLPLSPGCRLSAGVCPYHTFFLWRQWDQCVPTTLPSTNHMCTCTHTRACTHTQAAYCWPHVSGLALLLHPHGLAPLPWRTTAPLSCLRCLQALPTVSSAPSHTSAPSGLRHSPSWNPLGLPAAVFLRSTVSRGPWGPSQWKPASGCRLGQLQGRAPRGLYCSSELWPALLWVHRCGVILWSSLVSTAPRALYTVSARWLFKEQVDRSLSRPGPLPPCGPHFALSSVWKGLELTSSWGEACWRPWTASCVAEEGPTVGAAEACRPGGETCFCLVSREERVFLLPEAPKKSA